MFLQQRIVDTAWIMLMSNVVNSAVFSPHHNSPAVPQRCTARIPCCRTIKIHFATSRPPSFSSSIHVFLSPSRFASISRIRRIYICISRQPFPVIFHSPLTLDRVNVFKIPTMTHGDTSRHRLILTLPVSSFSRSFTFLTRRVYNCVCNHHR